MRFYPLVPRLLLVLGLTALTSCGGAAPPSDSDSPAVAEPVPTEPPASTPTQAEPTPTTPATTTPTPTEPTTTESWESAPPMQNARSAHSVVSTGDAIYALGGTGEGNAPVLEVERFDGSIWTVETTLPGEGLNAPASVLLNRRIYVVGGFETTGNTPTDEVHVYELATQTWSEAAPLPEPRGGHAAVELNGRIHVLGGGNSVSTIADHSMYDPATDTWTELAPLPRAKGSPAAVAYDGKIYLIGGRSGSSDFGDVDIYDPSTDTWTPGPAIQPRGTTGALLYRNAIYVFGGESQASRATLDSVLRLDPASNTWEEASAMPTARNYARAVLFDDAVYVVGGSPTPGSSHSSAGSNVVERFHIAPSD